MTNELKKKIIHNIGVFIVGIILSSLIWGAICIRLTVNSDRNLREAEQRLSAANTRLELAERQTNQCQSVVGECSAGLTEITNRLGSDNTSLSEVISNLRIIQKEVEHMENCISDYNSNSSNFNNSINTETEQQNIGENQ